MKPRILLVDDDKNILAAYTRILHKHFETVTANSGLQALQTIQSQEPFSVVIADMHMPGMTGLELLKQIRDLDPNIIRVMMTGDAEQKTAVDAVNCGEVFRFLNKPCPPDELVHAIERSLHQFELVHVEKEILEDTLAGALQVMTDLLSTLDPQAFGSATRLRERALKLAALLKVDRDWEIGLAALLSPIGRMTIAPPVIQKLQTGHPMSAEELSLIERVPEFGANLLMRIPRLEGVAEAVLYQNKGFDGSGFPAEAPGGKAIPLAARILKPLADLMRLEHQRPLPQAINELKARASLYDPEILTATLTLVQREMEPGEACTLPARDISINELKEGHVLASHVMTVTGKLVLFPGTRLSAGHIQLLQNLAELLDLREPIQIHDERS